MNAQPRITKATACQTASKCVPKSCTRRVQALHPNSASIRRLVLSQLCDSSYGYVCCTITSRLTGLTLSRPILNLCFLRAQQSTRKRPLNVLHEGPRSFANETVQIHTFCHSHFSHFSIILDFLFPPNHDLMLHILFLVRTNVQVVLF